MSQILFPPRTTQTARAAAMFSCVLALATCAVQVGAGEVLTGSDDVAAVHQFDNDSTVLVLRLDPKGLALPNLGELLKPLSPEVQSAYKQWTAPAGQFLDWLRASLGDQPVYATVGVPLSKSQWPVFVVLKQTASVNADSLRERFHLAQPAQVCVRGEFLVVSPVPHTDVARLLDTVPPSPRAELAIALEAIGSYPIQLAILPPGYVWRTVEELMPELPAQLGGGSSKVLTDGCRWAAMGIDPAGMRVELVVQSASDSAAQSLASHLPKLLQSLYDALPKDQKPIPPEAFTVLFNLIHPQVTGSRVIIRHEGLPPSSDIVQLLASLASQIQDTRRQLFKQMLLGMHNYHEVFKSFPPGDKQRDAKGNTKLSWRVYLLPFVGEQALYNEFHLDEPWDSSHNKPLIAKMPVVYKSGLAYLPSDSKIQPGYTTFLAPVGEDTVMGGPKATRIRDILDGTSNTIMLVEVKPELAVPWTAPDDYAFDAKSPGSGLQIGPHGRFLAAFADGSVRELPADLKPDELLHLFQKKDGHPVNLDRAP